MKHFESVKKILIDHLCIQESDIHLETPLTELGADSLDVVEIKLDLEREYDVEFPEDKEMVLVGDFVSQLDDLLGKQ